MSSPQGAPSKPTDDDIRHADQVARRVAARQLGGRAWEDIDLDEEYLPSIDLTTGRPVGTADEPEALRLTDHHEVDLEPSVRDAISLAEPNRFLWARSTR